MVNDESGGRLILRGTNVSADAKRCPDLLPPYGEADFARLRDEIGASAIRLLVFWEAIEPEPGRYHEAYLRGVRARVEAAGRAGLRVIVDMHQDLWGRGFGSAGAPEWAGDARDYDAYRPARPWMLGYFRPEISRAFDRLWNDEALQGAFAAAWARLAFALRDAPAVFAYDVLNEPFWGTGHPDRFDRCVAPRFYARVIEAIRAVDPRPWIAIEPAAIASTGWRSSFLAPRRERLLFAPHLYPPAVELGIGWPGDRAALDRHVARLAGTAANAGLPWLAGEVGVRREVPGAVQYLEEALDALDVAHAGFFHWDLGRSASGYALWEEDGSPSALARALARAQPVRIAGEPIRWHWDRDARRFELEWNEDGSASGETIVAVPTLAFPDGFVAHLDDGAPSRVEGTRIHVSQSGGTRRLRVVP